MALTRNRLIGNLANATDSAASSSFLAKGATEANYQSIAYSDVTSKPTILDSAGITSILIHRMSKQDRVQLLLD